MRALAVLAVCAVLVVVGALDHDAVGFAVVGVFVAAVILVRAVIIGITRVVLDEIGRR
jgi:hypothetical protein